jgi:hypothetical protein
MTEVEDFLMDFEGAQGEVLRFLHDLLLSFPEIEDKMRYRIPFYYRKSWVCYLNPGKKGDVDLSFIRGSELSNEQGLLDGRGRKQVASLNFSTVDEIPVDAVLEIVQEAFILDESVPFPHKRFGRK